MYDPRTGSMEPISDASAQEHLRIPSHLRTKVIFQIGQEVVIKEGRYVVAKFNGRREMVLEVITHDAAVMPGTNVECGGGYFRVKSVGGKMVILIGIAANEFEVVSQKSLRKEIKSLESRIEAAGQIPITKQDGPNQTD